MDNFVHFYLNDIVFYYTSKGLCLWFYQKILKHSWIAQEILHNSTNVDCHFRFSKEIFIKITVIISDLLCSFNH